MRPSVLARPLHAARTPTHPTLPLLPPLLLFSRGAGHTHPSPWRSAPGRSPPRTGRTSPRRSRQRRAWSSCPTGWCPCRWPRPAGGRHCRRAWAGVWGGARPPQRRPGPGGGGRWWAGTAFGCSASVLAGPMFARVERSVPGSFESQAFCVTKDGREGDQACGTCTGGKVWKVCVCVREAAAAAETESGACGARRRRRRAGAMVMTFRARRWRGYPPPTRPSRQQHVGQCMNVRCNEASGVRGEPRRHTRPPPD